MTIKELYKILDKEIKKGNGNNGIVVETNSAMDDTFEIEVAIVRKNCLELLTK